MLHLDPRKAQLQRDWVSPERKPRRPAERGDRVTAVQMLESCTGMNLSRAADLGDASVPSSGWRRDLCASVGQNAPPVGSTARPALGGKWRRGSEGRLGDRRGRVDKAGG